MSRIPFSIWPLSFPIIGKKSELQNKENKLVRKEIDAKRKRQMREKTDSTVAIPVHAEIVDRGGAHEMVD